MNQEDKRRLRRQLIDLLEAYQKDPQDAEVRRLARDVHARHKGQIALLDEDTAKAVQLIEDIAYQEQMPELPKQRVTDVLAQLRTNAR